MHRFGVLFYLSDKLNYWEDDAASIVEVLFKFAQDNLNIPLCDIERVVDNDQGCPW